MHGVSKCVIGVECACGMELSRFGMGLCVSGVCMWCVAVHMSMGFVHAS